MRDVARASPPTAPALLGVALEAAIPARLTCVVLMHRDWAKPVDFPEPIDHYWKTLHAGATDAALADPTEFTKQALVSHRDPLLMHLAGATAPRVVWLTDERLRRPGAFSSPGHDRLIEHYGVPERLYFVHPLDLERDWLLVGVLARGAAEAPFAHEDVALLRVINDEIVATFAGDFVLDHVGDLPVDIHAQLAALSDSQRRLMPMLIQGLPEAEIAAKIHRSRHTVHDHVKQIYKALGVSSRIELVVRYGGLISTLGVATANMH